MSDDFYAQLPACPDFSAAMDVNQYTAVPNDWYVIITDVKGSTKAIDAGKYKEVNMLGASSIVALLNVAGDLEIPYAFGGDGATVLIPPSLLATAKPALAATQQMARQSFGLELRAGIVQVATAVAAQHPILIAKFQPSPHYDQAMFAGGGLAYAEKLIKDPQTADLYALSTDIIPQGDFSGLECRWQDIPSQYGETISLLVTALSDQSEKNNQIYQAVLAKIQEIYGDARQYHPLALTHLKGTYNPKRLAAEIGVRSEPGLWPRFKYLLKLWFAVTFLKITTRFDLTTNDIRWRDYLEIVVETADYRKYDDTLRMIVSGNAPQREALTAYLEAQFQQGHLIYGLHITNRALLTCLVFERMGRQVHFVDGADGGYALAAKALKQRLADQSSSRLSASQPLTEKPD